MFACVSIACTLFIITLLHWLKISLHFISQCYLFLHDLYVIHHLSFHHLYVTSLSLYHFTICVSLHYLCVTSLSLSLHYHCVTSLTMSLLCVTSPLNVLSLSLHYFYTICIISLTLCHFSISVTSLPQCHCDTISVSLHYLYILHYLSLHYSRSLHYIYVTSIPPCHFTISVTNSTTSHNFTTCAV